MKAYHFVLIFLIFFIAAVIKTDINIGKLKSIENEKEMLTTDLDSATWDAINNLAESGAYGTNMIKKDDLLNTFFSSLYSSMGIMSDTDAQKEIEMYIPVILLCDTDGYYVYYYDKYKAADGLTYTGRKWSEKMPYYYEDDCFVYRFTLTDYVRIYDKNNLLSADQKLTDVDYHEIQTNDIYADFRAAHPNSILLNDETYELAKKGAILKRLEKTMAYYTNNHNDIAQQNGITYHFSFPAGQEKEWAGYIDDVSLLVVFQGYPYGADKNYTFNKIASCGANVIRNTVYYVEKKGWYYLAHNAGCDKLKDSTTVLDETFDKIEDCIKMGAYCDDCIDYGARVPTIQ